MRIVFSYDCEGNWGDVDLGSELLSNDRYPELLDAYRWLTELHARCSVPASFAFVGLFGVAADRRDDLLNGELAQELVDSPFLRRSGGCWEGHTMRSMVAQSPYCRLASHSLTHRPLTELSSAQARLEVRMASQLLREWTDDETSAHGPLGFVYPRNLVAHTELVTSAFDSYRETPANRRSRAAAEMARTVVGFDWPEAVTSDFVFWRGGARERFSDNGFRRLWQRRMRSAQRGNGGDDRLVHVWSHPHNLVTDPSLRDRLEWLVRLLSEHRDFLTFEYLDGFEHVG